MQSITAAKCIYSTTRRTWAIEIALDDGEDKKRFDVAGAEDAEQFIEALGEASHAGFDAQSGEVHFFYEFAMEDDDSEDDEEDDEESDDEDEDEEDEEDDKRSPRKQ